MTMYLGKENDQNIFIVDNYKFSLEGKYKDKKYQDLQKKIKNNIKSIVTSNSADAREKYNKMADKFVKIGPGAAHSYQIYLDFENLILQKVKKDHNLEDFLMDLNHSHNLEIDYITKKEKENNNLIVEKTVMDKGTNIKFIDLFKSDCFLLKTPYKEIRFDINGALPTSKNLNGTDYIAIKKAQMKVSYDLNRLENTDDDYDVEHMRNEYIKDKNHQFMGIKTTDKILSFIISNVDLSKNNKLNKNCLQEFFQYKKQDFFMDTYIRHQKTAIIKDLNLGESILFKQEFLKSIVNHQDLKEIIPNLSDLTLKKMEKSMNKLSLQDKVKFYDSVNEFGKNDLLKKPRRSIKNMFQ